MLHNRTSGKKSTWFVVMVVLALFLFAALASLPVKAHDGPEQVERYVYPHLSYRAPSGGLILVFVCGHPNLKFSRQWRSGHKRVIVQVVHCIWI